MCSDNVSCTGVVTALGDSYGYKLFFTASAAVRQCKHAVYTTFQPNKPALCQCVGVGGSVVGHQSATRSRSRMTVMYTDDKAVGGCGVSR